ncbi:MAG TPA: methylmalonyl-CoA epimerase [Firmicutes bacterium]|uniref:Methylmalonyl-CoA epimerase n=1 Tax=Candidatus Fermentithermobacillus carboniphilus TaxID=3085328 RepID=A0AAT9LBJ2_9FIRM|nr:MAG: methylmalonyl-CoA epimerase [Candidatus Fermentithermobacillus carboniphilus]HHW17684.1 methylmalonyl-CoA epimerase [Candidatus Fermentithermobacillaceae bacterium]
MLKRIHHLGIAVKDLELAKKTLEDALGLVTSAVEEVPTQKVRVAFVPVGESRLELLEPTQEDSTVQKFLETRGEGFHHIAFETDDLEADLKKAESHGLRLIDKEPRPGAHGTKVAFIHPKSTFGLLIELVQE